MKKFLWLSKKEISDLIAGMPAYVKSRVFRGPTRAQLIAENDRLLNIIADPEILRMEIEKGEVNMECRAPHWAAKLLTWSFKDSIADAKNFVVLNLGDEEHGRFEVTIKRYYGKSPAQLHDEEIAALKEARNDAEEDYSDLIDLCENLLKEFDAHIAANDRCASDDRCESSVELDVAIDAIRNHVSPTPTKKD